MIVLKTIFSGDENNSNIDSLDVMQELNEKVMAV